jgi:hypothetical protein
MTERVKINFLINLLNLIDYKINKVVLLYYTELYISKSHEVVIWDRNS